ncbi:YihY/virulence factor BrkB family protein [Amycolatopsis rhizosphaerae]|uniref:YihY/virulence factor BrkB family protein n=1 Tax=Amycolatopsis rhizosphaerae TaxID=2053003 RepID=A0A558CV07_9PSEU|nr:YihY/virulence factor BrkB family protein [Amycolatopsis rhizosphaerae]TVT52609.1 YihY/virulence factor BrkB family protein [Amycolatopsis rhizosphaerae]
MNQQKGRSGSQVKAKLEQVDRFQREHRAVAVPVAVVRKFAEDRSPQLASMIAFWAFFSIFPLFLVFVTLLGFFLPSNLRNNVLTTVGTMFPLVDPSSLQGLTGSWWALILGLVTALWSGMRAVRVTQFAFNSVWELPYKDRPKFVEQIGRSLSVLVTIGLGLVLTTLVTGFVAGAAGALGFSWTGHLLGYAVAVVLDVGLFVAAFRILTNREITTRDVLPGAMLSGLLFFVLQSLSSLIISRYLHTAQRTYGQFATVITLLWWFYLQSIVTLLGAQLNVVLKEHLHPRALAASLDTEADERAYRAYAQERAYHDDEHIRTEFRDKR